MVAQGRQVNDDLDRDERIAAALPRDWPGDFYGVVSNNVCEKCQQVFKGNAWRVKCRVCAENDGERK